MHLLKLIACAAAAEAVAHATLATQHAALRPARNRTGPDGTKPQTDRCPAVACVRFPSVPVRFARRETSRTENERNSPRRERTGGSLANEKRMSGTESIRS